MSLEEIEARLEDTIFAKAGDKASEYVHPAHVRLLIRAVRQLGARNRHRPLCNIVTRGSCNCDYSNIDPDVLALLGQS